MVKIEWFDLDSNVVQEYLNKAVSHIEIQYGRHHSHLTKSIKDKVFCDNTGKFSKKKVKRFLQSTRQELKEQDFFYNYMQNPHLSKRCEKAIKKIINYNMIHYQRGTTNNKYTLHQVLLSSLNFDCCPYCNRQYITSYRDTSRIRHTTADLDHFYPKSIYPLFALSLFNFVPSCQICNSRMKKDDWKDCLYPYEESFGDDAVFRISEADKTDKKSDEYYQKLLDAFLGKSDGEFSIVIDNMAADSILQQRIDNSKKLFKLEEVYQTHQEYVRELLIKQRIYDEGAYLDMLRDQFAKYGLSFGDTELELFLYGFRWDDVDHHTRPLSKLTYDIIKRQ